MTIEERYLRLIDQMREEGFGPIEFHRRLWDLAASLHDFDVLEHCGHAIAAYSPDDQQGG